MMAQTTSHPNLPSELYYPICKYIASPCDLRTLASSTRVLQRPAEAALHHTVVLPSRRAGAAFCAALKTYPRFASLVCELTFEWPTPSEEDTSSDGTGAEYWCAVRAALGTACALHTLVLDDGRNLCLSWVLDSLRPAQLRVLRCAFVLDSGLLGILCAQTSLEELAWTGALIALPDADARDNKLHSSRGVEGEIGDDKADTDLGSELESGSEGPDAPLLAALAHLLPRSALPRLRILHAESLALARALVPGRPVTHLWVPGVSFGAAYASDYLYRHISALSLPFPSPSPSTPSSTPRESPPPRLLRRPAGPTPDLSPQAHATHLRYALRAFSRSTRGVYSLRIALDLPSPELRAVLACMACALPHLRALAYLPAAALEPLPVSDKTGFHASDKDQGLDPGLENSIFPLFPHLHTLSVWSTPSRGTLRRLGLERANALPALRTLACLHFSPAFEWMCLPVGDDDSDGSGDGNGHKYGDRETEGGGEVEEETATGGIRWQRVGPGQRAQRRPTALHDPENLLWRDV